MYSIWLLLSICLLSLSVFVAVKFALDLPKDIPRKNRQLVLLALLFGWIFLIVSYGIALYHLLQQPSVNARYSESILTLWTLSNSLLASSLFIYRHQLSERLMRNFLLCVIAACSVLLSVWLLSVAIHTLSPALPAGLTIVFASGMIIVNGAYNLFTPLKQNKHNA